MAPFAIALLLLAMPVQASGTAMLIDEIDTGTGTKLCVYGYLGERHIITIMEHQLCPLTLKVH